MSYQMEYSQSLLKRKASFDGAKRPRSLAIEARHYLKDFDDWRILVRPISNYLGIFTEGVR